MTDSLSGFYLTLFFLVAVVSIVFPFIVPYLLLFLSAYVFIFVIVSAVKDNHKKY